MNITKQRLFTDEINLIYNTINIIYVNFKNNEKYETILYDLKTLEFRKRIYDEKLVGFYKYIYNYKQWYIINKNGYDYFECNKYNLFNNFGKNIIKYNNNYIYFKYGKLNIVSGKLNNYIKIDFNIKTIINMIMSIVNRGISIINRINSNPLVTFRGTDNLNIIHLITVIIIGFLFFYGLIEITKLNNNLLSIGYYILWVLFFPKILKIK